MTDKDKDRLRQVLRWLTSTYKAPYRRVELRFRKLARGTIGLCIEGKKNRSTIWIYLDPEMPSGFATEVLIHEYAHAIVFPSFATGAIEEHGPEWAGAYGKLYRHYFDNGGREISREC